MSHPLPPRLHRCGNQLNRVFYYEIVPAGQWAYEQGVFVPIISTEEGDDIRVELRCPHCMETLNGKESKWFLDLMKDPDE